MHKITYITLLLFAYVQSLWAQSSIPLKFHALPQGISSNNVSAIIQDSRGFMWFGTANGLNKFDGYNYTIYEHNPNDSTTIASKLINKIYEDKKGNLWICLDGGGISYFDQKSETFTSYIIGAASQQVLSNSVLSVYEDNEGLVWFTIEHNPLTSFNPKTKAFKTYEQFGGKDVEQTCRFILKGDDKYLWIGTVGNGIARFDKQKGDFTYFTQENTELSEDFIRNFSETRHKNKFWISYASEGISLISIENNTIKVEKTYPQDDFTEGYIRTIFEDSQQRLWVGIENGGINILDTKTDTISKYKHQKEELFSLPSDSPWAIYEDKSHNIWIGTFNKGVAVAYNEYHDKFEHYTQREGLANNSVSSFQQDAEGQVWITTDGGGISRWNPKSKKFETYNQNTAPPAKLSGNAIISVSKDKAGQLWFGTWNKGMNIYNPESGTFQTLEANKNGLTTNTSFASTSGKDGYLYVLSWEYALDVIDPLTKTLVWTRNLAAEQLNYAQYIMSDSKDNIWIASRSGLGFIANEELKPDGKIKLFTLESGKSGTISDQSINTLYEDSQQNIWVGTVSGLNLYLPETQTFKVYRKKEGLPHNNIKGIVEDLKGNLWISTARGLSKFNPKTQKFENYFQEDGLQGNEFSRSAIFCTKEGEILLGGNNGFNVFKPNQMKSNPYKPEVYIKDFKLFNKPVKIQDEKSPLKQHISFTKEITLNHKQTVFTIEFVALNYTHPEKNQYAYILEGFEQEWNYVGGKQEATYTNLPAGTYTFRVKACNNDGVWNEEGTALKIIVLPPWWDTVWFKTLSISLLILIIFLGIRWRFNIIKQQNIILEDKVKQRTQELSTKNEEILEKSEELSKINELLNEKQQEITTQNEELQQQSEELITQRDFLEEANTKLNDSHKKINIQKEELEQKNRQIQQSINAALAIQQAILPYQERMNKLLGEYFVLYRPKDIVSGDFYWVEKVDNKIMIVVADCTGHGIPGAFMTLIGSTLLDRLVKSAKITDPAIILQKLHDNVYKALKQKYTGNNYGMDAIVLSVEHTESKQSKLVFSGAKNPFHYIDINKPEEVVRVKGSRKAIGGYQNKQIAFENKEVVLDAGSLVYLATDGYKDQNDTNRKRLGRTKFSEAIKKAATLAPKDQLQVFEQVLEEHMEGTVQRDDILVLGFKLS